MSTGMWDEGLAARDKVTEVNPRDYGACERKGEFLTVMGRTDDTLLAFNRALQLIPANDRKERSMIWMAKAQALSYIDRDEENLEALDKVTEINPLFLEAWQEKGFVLEKLGRSKESITSYDEALRIDSWGARSWITSADGLSRLERYNESLLAYDKALQYIAVSDSKTQATTWIGKGDALSKAGKQALSDDSNGTSLLQLKAEAFFKQSKYDEALKANGAAIEAAAPGSLYVPTSWIRRGRCPESSGKE